MDNIIRFVDVCYGYNAAGHIENVTENGKLKVRYTYDKLDRLIREDNKALGVTTVFLYDNGGNLLCQREFEYGLDDVEELLVRDEVLYGYANSDRPDQLTSFNGEKIEYNVNGMPTTYRGNTCTYTRGTLLATFGENTFAYDADGLRTRKNDTVYTYLNKKLLREVGPNDTIDFIYGAEGIMGINHNGTVYLFRKNVFGDVTHIYDTEGNLKARYIYDAWGNHRVFDGDGVDITESNDMNEIGLVNPIRYRSYYYDVETGLYYLRARYYDPETGRFISQDDTQFIDSQHLMGLHLYAYCGNNSIMREDSEGELWNFIIGGVVGAVVGGVVSAIESHRETGHVDGWKVAIGAVSGAASGLVAASGLGWIAQAGISAGISAGADFANQTYDMLKDDSKTSYDFGGTVKAASKGFLLSAVGSGLGSFVGKYVTRTSPRADQAFDAYLGKSFAASARKQIGRSSSALTRQANKFLSKSIMYDNITKGVSSSVGSVLSFFNLI